MNKLVPLVGVVGCSLACALACSSESSNDGNASSSSSSSGASSGDPTSSGGSTSGEPTDAGKKCQIATIGFDEGTIVESLPRAEGPGGVPWTDLDNAKATDEQFAKVTLAAGQESEELRITGFSFKIPAGAIFQGVEAQLKRQAPEGGIVDGFIALVGVKNQPGRGKFIATPWPSSIVGTHHYGQATDTWGMDLNPPDVAPPEFGVGIWVKRDPNDSGPANATALVDSLKIRVAYCQP